jgi:beta-glucosidase
LKSLDDKFLFLASEATSADQKQRKFVEELGLRQGGGSDGPAGVSGRPTATALPTPLTVAASFDPSVARDYGNLLGEEFFAAGMNTMWGPAMDIARTWHFGRLTESFGEDPFLTASLATPEVAAIQSHHVRTTLKHFAAYTQEQGRIGYVPIGKGQAVNEQVSDTALREIYLPGFESAVNGAKPAAVMCAFPRVNGTYNCENEHLLGILKSEWKFDGSVLPDFPDAQRSIVPAFKAGLDDGVMEAPSGAMTMMQRGGYLAGGKSLRQAVQDGEIPESRIDDMILRELVPSFRIGVFDHPAVRRQGEISTADHRAAAAKIVEAGAVLLKNDNSTLPLRASLQTIAVIGTQASGKAWVVEQGSPYVQPTHLVSVLDAIKERAANSVQVNYSPGTLGLEPLPPVPASSLRTPDGNPGILAGYYADPTMDFKGSPVVTEVLPTLDVTKAPNLPKLPPNCMWSVRYTTIFTPDQSGIQHFTLNGSSSARLFIDDKLMTEFSRTDFGDVSYANVPMVAGKPAKIRVEYTARESYGIPKMQMFGSTFGVNVRLGFAEPNRLIEEAVESASHSDVAIVVVGFRVGEGMDRLHLNLASDQDQLIQAVSKANPHTIVILNTGGAVTMPWLDRAAAVLETWLPGDADGPATASLLFGDASPGGKLPVTFPADETQGPGTEASEYPGTTDSNAALDTAHFNEGLLVGYRYWDAHKQRPLFEFGYGLSYTQFSIQGLGAVALPGGGAKVTVRVRNIGSRAGADVVQVYVGFPVSAGEPPQQLKTFRKVFLRPGEEQTIQLELDAQAFRQWSAAEQKWVVAPGQYQLRVGDSSRSITWTTSMTPQGASSE